MKTFERSGMRFRYPSNWTLDMDDAGDGWTVTVQSPDTAFVLVSLRPDADGPEQVAAEALDALKAEYAGLDPVAAVDTVAGTPALGHDIDFLTLDTAITTWTRCIDTTAGPLLVMGQVSDYDRERNEPVLRAVFASVELDP
jgi:fructose 1,6-bisphosphatase